MFSVRPLARTLTLLVPLVALLGACQAPEPVEEGPLRVLILGDSISMGYTPFVKELMPDAHVMRAMRPDGEKPQNCCGTNFATEHLERWLAQDGGDWDVIHFNFGLHDLKRVHPETGKNSQDPDDPHQADPERYDEQLRAIVARLKETDARLVFATTTPVPEGVRPYRAPEDPITYNRVALHVMRDEGVPINDLFAYVMGHEEMIKPKDVHYSKEGSRALGEEVVRAIRAVAKR